MELSKYGAQCPLIMCDVHHEEEPDIYCHTCKKPICLDCTKKDHANHKFDKFSKIARTFRLEIPTTIQEKTQRILSKHRWDLEKMTKAKDFSQNNMEGIVKRIDIQRDMIHGLVDSETDAMIANCRKRTDDRQRELEKCITTLQTGLQEVKELLSYLKESFSVLSIGNLVRLKIQFEKKLDELSQVHSGHNQQENELFYVEGNVIEDELKSMVGSFSQYDPSKVTII